MPDHLQNIYSVIKMAISVAENKAGKINSIKYKRYGINSFSLKDN